MANNASLAYAACGFTCLRITIHRNCKHFANSCGALFYTTSVCGLTTYYTSNTMLILIKLSYFRLAADADYQHVINTTVCG